MGLRKFFSVGNPDWTVRRRIVIYSLLFCAAEIVWASQWMRMETAPSIISQAFIMATFIIGGYVFGNVVDDHLKRKAEAGQLQPPPATQNVDITTVDTNVKAQ